MTIQHITRRGFLAAFGLAAGGLALGLTPANALETTATQVSAVFNPSVFLHVAADGVVTVVCHRSEMGQGVRGSLLYLLAAELGADEKRMKLVQADGDSAYGDQNTDGSSSMRKRYIELRRIAATAREALVAVAARKFGVKAATLSAKEGRVQQIRGARSLDFGQLVEAAAAAPLPDAATVKLRSDAELSIRTRTLPLIDARAFVTGKAIYGADVSLPNQLIAVIARPPVVGATVKQFDADKALAIAGVRRVLEMPVPSKPYAFQPWGGVAVLADTSWAAMRGRAALNVRWSASDNDGYDSLAYRAQMQRATSKPGELRRELGDAEGALKQAAKVIEADYYVPHLPHAPMEPPAALARYQNGELEVWAPTQNPQAAQKTAAQTLGLSAEKVVVHVTFLGGAFGRKSKADFVAEAAYLAKQTGVPVRVQWTREDDVQHDFYNAVSAQKLTAGLDAKGRVVAWRHRTCFPPISSLFVNGADTPSAGDLQQGVLDLALDVPNVRAEAVSAAAHVRVGWLRSVYNIFHAFAVGSFIDEIAHARGRSTPETLLEIIGPARKLSLADLGIRELSNYGQPLAEHPVDAGRLRGVIEQITQLCSWEAERKKGRALGIAAHRSFLAYVAVVVSLVRRDGRVQVDEAWVVVDAGTVVNRDRAISQMEGSLIFGMTQALFGGVTFKGGRAEQTNFHDLRLLRMPDAPDRIHVEIVDSTHPPAGIGEPGVPPVAPALANAYFALTGTRLREFPMAEHFLGRDAIRGRRAH